MRTAVEVLDLYCKKTKEPGEDEVNLKFDRATLWSGPIRSGITRKIEVIKVIPDPTGIVELWQEDSPRRTVNSLGRQTIRQLDADSGTLSAQFTTEGGRLHPLLQVPASQTRSFWNPCDRPCRRMGTAR